MNKFKLLAHSMNNGFATLEVTFDDFGHVKQEIKGNSETIGDIPHIITDLYTLSLWDKLNKDMTSFKNLFLKQHNGIWLKPMQLKREEGKITGSGYYIHINPAGVLVNYKKGKFKEFTMLYQALEWIQNVHLPAQQKKLLDEVIM